MQKNKSALYSSSYFSIDRTKIKGMPIINFHNTKRTKLNAKHLMFIKQISSMLTTIKCAHEFFLPLFTKK